MRKLIGAINMSIDGYCDHTSIQPDEAIHQHYTDLITGASLILYGRKTYQLMQFWQNLLVHPSGEKHMDDFAQAIHRIPKIVFSQTLQETGWDTAEISALPLSEAVAELKSQEGADILAGSRSLILQLLRLRLLDELQLCIHPVLAGSGLPLFESGPAQHPFRLNKTKAFRSGAVVLYYEL